LIVNDDYRTTWYESEMTGTLSILGEPVTTTVREIGLIDSYKTVSPTWALPGTDTVLTYVVHVVNSSPNELSGVQVSDIFPWENTTYQRDAVASSGTLVSDVVSLEWTGDLAPYSETLITFTAVVDDFFEGVITNTATITHTSLQQEKVVSAVAYITSKPELRISKIATPDPVAAYTPLLYQIEVTNLGQQATLLVITDTIPVNTSYIFGSASSGGQEEDGVVTWNLPVLSPGETIRLTFQVTVQGGSEVINDSYAVRCDEGVFAYGEPVITYVNYPIRRIMLPITGKDWVVK
jgi:large repetitive protein